MLTTHAIRTHGQSRIVDFGSVGNPQMLTLLGHDVVRGAHVLDEDPAILLGFHHAHPLGQGEGVEEIAIHRLRDGVFKVLLQCQRAKRLGDRGFVDDFHRDSGGRPVG